MIEIRTELVRLKRIYRRCGVLTEWMVEKLNGFAADLYEILAFGNGKQRSAALSLLEDVYGTTFNTLLINN